MIETILVSVSGPAFSFLLYENVKSEFDQEGFLLGEVRDKEIKTITDNDQEVIKLERLVKINSALPCPQLSYFYDAAGKIDEEKLNSFLHDKASKVVAWYKFKHTSDFKLTLREKIIHKQLASLFNTPSDLFTTCLLTTESSDNQSTHLYSQTFVRYSNFMYQPLPMHIVNLSDPNNAYRTPQPISGMVETVLESLKVDFKRTQGLEIVGELHNALQKQIEEILGDLADTEKVFELEEEVKQLRQQLKWKTDSRKSGGELDNSMENKCVENGLVTTSLEDTPSDSRDSSPELEKNITRGRGKAVRNNSSPIRCSARNLKTEVQDTVKNRSQISNKVRKNTSYSQVAQKGK